jgi:integral membrane sensor domain MASE1
LARRRDLIWFTGIVVAGALVSGIVYVCTFAVAGLGPSGSLLEAVVRYWVGDAVGMVVLLPILLVATDPLRRAALSVTMKSWDWWLIALLISALLAVVFGRDDRDHFKFFYLLFLPVVWASARLGLPGAVSAAGLTQVGLIIAVQSAPNPDPVFDFRCSWRP